MSLTRKIARPLLGAAFVAEGIGRLRHSGEAGDKLESSLQELESMVPQAEQVTGNPQRTAQVLGGVEVAAGAALAIGRFPRTAACVLSGVQLVNTYVEYRGAQLDDVGDLQSQRATLLKNLAILGGLKIASVDLAGRPSLSWRAEHLAKDMKKNGTAFRDKTIKWAEDLGDDAVKSAKAFERDASKTFKRAERDAKRSIKQATREAEKKVDS
ncbi:MAG: DoxX family protein [Nesterenkonia sp.]|nr:DoxX family protein [Nesterenkonia sp.]